MEPKYKLGDTIENINGHRGEIFNIQFSEISNEYIYHIRIEKDMYPNSNLASIKESNVKNVSTSIHNIDNIKNDNKSSRKKK